MKFANFSCDYVSWIIIACLGEFSGLVVENNAGKLNQYTRTPDISSNISHHHSLSF